MSKRVNQEKDERTEQLKSGSVCEKGDKVKFKYWEDDFHQAYAYGTVYSRLNENIVIVKVILRGRTKDMIEYHEIPFEELEPHFADDEDEENEYYESEVV